jgi:hypothetical protein
MPSATLSARPSANGHKTDASEEAFEIVATQVVLEDLRANQPFARVVLGDIARTPKRGGYVARSECQTITGPGRFKYWQWNPTAEKTGECLKAPDDLLSRILTIHEEITARPGLNDLAPTAFEADRAKFEAMFPALMPHFGLSKVKLPRLFEPGKCQHPKFVQGVGEIPWGEFLERHLAGDFGAHGHVDPEALVDPEAVWLVGLAPVSVQNLYSIRSGQGVVRSVYELEPTDHANAKPGKSACIVTVLGVNSRVGTLLCVRQNNMLIA